MLKQSWRLVSRVERVGDFFITILAFFAAYYGRSSLIYWNQVFGWQLPFAGPELAPINDYFVVLILAVVSYSVVLNLLGAYSSMRFLSSWQLFQMFLLSSLLVFFTLAAALFLLKVDLSRSFIVLFCSLMVLMLAAERYVVLWFLRYFRRRGFNFRNVIICGIGKQAQRLAAEIARKPELGIRVRSFADLRESSPEVLQSVQDLRVKMKSAGLNIIPRTIIGCAACERALKEYAVDEVIFTDIVNVLPLVEEMVFACAEQGVRTTIAADLFSVGIIKSGLSYFADMPLIHFQTPPGDRWDLAVKRLIDIVVSTVLLVSLSPLLLLIALLVRISSAGPILFVQKRIGLNGHYFSLYKFRSMFLDAEDQLESLKQSNEMSGPAFKMKNDPRVTSIGSYLRRYSLDELPQLWNVLKGDMSLVGPRPPVPGEVRAYERRYRRRLSMRPGITCTWQVSGRNEISDFGSWVKLDLDYIDNWSLGRDLVLMLRTIPAVLFGTGAR